MIMGTVSLKLTLTMVGSFISIVCTEISLEYSVFSQNMLLFSCFNSWGDEERVSDIKNHSNDGRLG